jgi:L-ascorbate metabolism protein UlaG (beta-lactamase superfamily)
MQLPSDASSAKTAADRLSVTWLGHATFLMRSPKGVRVMFDPWLTGNPLCPADAKRIDKMDGLELVLVTHGHSDHCGDAVNVGRKTGATVVASPELAGWLERQGLKNLRPMNIGGRQTLLGIEIAMVQAVHSSSGMDSGNIVYLGPATGFVVKFENGLTIYFAGDTGLFGDMRMLRERFAPSVAFLPIGDRVTMGPDDAAVAGEWLGAKKIVPMHYGTFPELTGTPDRLREFCSPKGIEVVELRPGERAAL